ncbi:HD domain-containing protein [Rhodopirellula europaea]|uniref:HD domain-containing protein n=1 Tax=Rhodopirellula europaea TaxID=1263866 RepID=UPI003D2D892C|tara:strand:+ start:387 stop:986 length:600 start_codon:yes stop_codon:yes gene_type:complete
MNQKVDTSLAECLENAKTAADKVSLLFQYMDQHGQSFYDESVTQLQHGLQAAFLARTNGATDEQVTAALLHDIGHFLMDEHDAQGDFLQEDWCHETVGADLLEPFFPTVIIESIRQHVPAKRYLCAVDPHYHDGLSQASKRSLDLQGGKFTPEEVAEFEKHPHHETVVLVRRWDDGAKIEDLEVPGLEAYRETVESCLR